MDGTERFSRKKAVPRLTGPKWLVLVEAGRMECFVALSDAPQLKLTYWREKVC